MTSHFRVNDIDEKVARTRLGVRDFVRIYCARGIKTTIPVRLARFFGAFPTYLNAQTDDAGKKGPGTSGLESWNGNHGTGIFSKGIREQESWNGIFSKGIMEQESWNGIFSKGVR